MKNNRTEQLTPCGAPCAATITEPAAERIARARVKAFNTVVMFSQKYKYDYDKVSDAIKELVKKGFKYGRFEDYSVVTDLWDVLTACETIVKLTSEDN